VKPRIFADRSHAIEVAILKMKERKNRFVYVLHQVSRLIAYFSFFSLYVKHSSMSEHPMHSGGMGLLFGSEFK
jgi:hypothetical protein